MPTTISITPDRQLRPAPVIVLVTYERNPAPQRRWLEIHNPSREHLRDIATMLGVQRGRNKWDTIHYLAKAGCLKVL